MNPSEDDRPTEHTSNSEVVDFRDEGVDRSSSEAQKVEPEVIVDEDDDELVTRRTSRVRRKRVLDDLNTCNCGDIVSSNEEGVIECKRPGCETRWVSFY